LPFWEFGDGGDDGGVEVFLVEELKEE